MQNFPLFHGFRLEPNLSFAEFWIQNPKTRITVQQIRENEWFKKNYHPVKPLEYEDVNLDDVNTAFDEDVDPLMLNAFDLIIFSQGLNLSTLFDRGQETTIYQTRFISQKPAKVVLSSMEVVAQSMGYKTHICNYKMRVEGISASKTSHFSIIMEVFEIAPAYFMVDIQKMAGDAAEYLKFYKNFCVNLEDIIWRPPCETVQSRVTNSKSKRR